MKATRTYLPETSVLHSQKEFKFIDGYKAKFADNEDEIDIQKIGKLFFASGSKWIDKLFAVRNKIVKLFGLKTSDKIAEKEEQLKNFRCEPNEQIGLFKVFQKTENEVIIGEDDKHLDFRVSLFLEQSAEKGMKELTISTSVKFNNRFGKLYFVPVKPFHKLIVPTMLKGIIKSINKEKQLQGKS